MSAGVQISRWLLRQVVASFGDSAYASNLDAVIQLCVDACCAPDPLTPPAERVCTTAEELSQFCGIAAAPAPAQGGGRRLMNLFGAADSPLGVPDDAFGAPLGDVNVEGPVSDFGLAPTALDDFGAPGAAAPFSDLANSPAAAQAIGAAVGPLSAVVRTALQPGPECRTVLSGT